MGELRVLVLGVGDAFSAHHHTTSFLVQADGCTLGLECPDSLPRVLRLATARAGLRLGVEAIDHVLVTHLHGDHSNGLEGLACLKRFREGKKLSLLLPPELQPELWEHRLQAAMGRVFDGSRYHDQGFADYFELVPLSWEGPTQVGPFSIRIRPNRHHVPAHAVLIGAGDRTFGYSGDTAQDEAGLEFLLAADLIAHEANRGPGHTPYAWLAAQPPAVREKLRLVHCPDDFDPGSDGLPLLGEGDWLTI